MNKEKELKEHIEVFREYINSFAVYKENSTDAVNNQQSYWNRSRPVIYVENHIMFLGLVQVDISKMDN